MSGSGRRDDSTIALGAVVAVTVVAATSGWAGWLIAARLDTTVPQAPATPLSMARALFKREVEWPTAATPWAVGIGVAVLLLGGGVVGVVVSRRAARTGTLDEAARQLPVDHRGLQRYVTGTGPHIGRVVSGRSGKRPMISMTDEDQGVVIGGPRTGKTTTIAVPAVLDHRGPVLTTSNKADIFEAVAQHRARFGTVWLFDPQNLTGSGGPRWWWNPLRLARTVAGSRRLAAIWMHASRDVGARTDAFFDGAAEELLAQLLMAAAHHGDGDQVRDVFRWLDRPFDSTPETLLVQAPGGQHMASGLRANRQAPDKQRAGVYESAKRAVTWLADDAIRAWVEPGGGRVEYDPASLATSTDTLVSLSREGEGSATALVTALTAAVLQSAEQQAAQGARGRLPRPLLGVLDEVANVCRWRDLPDLYSHYGSRGIVLISLAQSWAQLAEAFGTNGAEKLWSAANVRVYGGGVSDTTFLRRLSDLAGEFDEEMWSHSTSIGGGDRRRSRSESVQHRRRATLDVAMLGALPRGRAVVMLSAARPVVVELTPYWERPGGAVAVTAPQPAAASSVRSLPPGTPLPPPPPQAVSR